MTMFNGLTKAKVDGQWTLIITDPHADTATPPKTVLNWTVSINSGFAPAHDLPIPTNTVVRGALTSPYPLKTTAEPTRGVGPGIVIASDNTLDNTAAGILSPHRGRLYLTYVDVPRV